MHKKPLETAIKIFNKKKLYTFAFPNHIYNRLDFGDNKSIIWQRI